jgi:prepilin-type N-terminal cleavage/methylation domain-containing protein
VINKKTGSGSHQTGFTLVEMAIVLMIAALLMMGLLPMLSGQIEKQRRTETRKILDEIQQALIGYAIINGKLPCPTTQTDPNNAAYGVADASCTSPGAEGYLPWKTLGVAEMDAWGIKRADSASLWIGYWRYRVEPAFAGGGAVTLNTTSNTTLDLQVKDSDGNRLTTTTERPVAIVFSTGPDLIPNGENAIYEPTLNATYQCDAPRFDNPDTNVNENFDDITIWISRPVLFNRMVAAGKLP